MKNLSLVGSLSSVDRSQKSEDSFSFGFDWAIRDNLNMKFNIANRDGGLQGSQQTRQFSLNGLIAKKLLWFDNIKIGSGINTSELTGKQIACDNALKLEAGFLGGQFLLDNTDKLDPKTGIYYTSRILNYETPKDGNKPLYLKYYRQDYVTANGKPAKKRDYSIKAKIMKALEIDASYKYGKDGQNNSYLPIGGSSIKLQKPMNKNIVAYADYLTDINDLTKAKARVWGLGITGTLSNGAKMELYYGLCNLFENGIESNDRVYRVKYDHKPIHNIHNGTKIRH